MKKRVLVVLLAVTVVLSMFTFPVSATKDWTGYIRISTPEDLLKMRNSDGKFYLTRNIDLKSYGKWKPISSFYGTFDGNGYAIKNLTSTSGGLFDLLGSFKNDTIIINLGLVNVDVQHDHNVGALSNLYFGTVTVENCYVTGNITCISTTSNYNSFASGFIGAKNGASDYNLSFKNCYNKANISSYSRASGIYGAGQSLGGSMIGVDDSASFINCINSGKISGNDKNGYIGGICGNLAKKMISCYNYGLVENVAINLMGGLVGTASEYAVMEDCATSTKTDIAVRGNKCTAKANIDIAKSDLKKQETYKGFDFKNMWYINPDVNNGYPILRSMMKHYKIPDESNGTTATAIELIITLKKGDALQLDTILTPTNSTDIAIWKTNKSSVVSVSTKGKVTAKDIGTGIITVTAGKLSQKIKIVVSE